MSRLEAQAGPLPPGQTRHRDLTMNPAQVPAPNPRISIQRSSGKDRPKPRLTCGTRGARPARRTLTLKPQRGLPAATSIVAGVRQARVLRCKNQESSQQGTPAWGHLCPLPAAKSHAWATSSSSLQKNESKHVLYNPAESMGEGRPLSPKCLRPHPKAFQGWGHRAANSPSIPHARQHHQLGDPYAACRRSQRPTELLG